MELFHRICIYIINDIHVCIHVYVYIIILKIVVFPQIPDLYNDSIIYCTYIINVGARIHEKIHF